MHTQLISDGAKKLAAIVIRNLSEETHRALKARAGANHRSTEAEVRSIIDAAVAPTGRLKLGTLLAEIGQQAGGDGLDITRDQSSRDPVDLA